MNFLKITDLACKQFKEFLAEKNVPCNNIRIYLSNKSCHGPIFNISVSELEEDDLCQKVDDITFILNKNLFIEYSGFILLCGEENGMGGFTLEPIHKPENVGCSSGCSSCEDCE